MKKSVFPALCLVAALGASAQTSDYDKALAAFGRYDFEEAESLLDTYSSKRKKDQIAADRIENPYKAGMYSDRVDDLAERIALGRNMLERVEKVAIVDSMTVDRDEFFRHFRLDPSIGRLLSTDQTERFPGKADEVVTPVYVSGDGEMMLWVDTSEADGNASFRLMESWLLADGSWETPRALFDRSTVFGDDCPGQIYAPFMMADGVTLYFAADGPQSLGGLDIFIARRDGDDGFLQPSNIGMPYNSPANDYMMVIDEVTGAGWWATDRNTDEDHVKIYVFKNSDLRSNYPSDTESIESYAMLSRFTPADGAVRADIFGALNALNHRKSAEAAFEFAMPDGRIMTRLTDFRSSEAREAMEEWLEMSATVARNRSELESLRMSRDATRGEIAAREDELERNLKKLKQLANYVVNSEIR